MATKDETVKVTEEYLCPGEKLIKKTREYPPKKTVSEWIVLCAQILAAFAVIVSIIALVIGAYQFKTQLAASAAQTLDQQHQTTLDTYLDRIQDMVLHDNFSTNSDAKALAAARTFTVLRYLDGYRKAYIIRFLYDVYLIGYVATNGSVYPPTINVAGVDLSGAVFATATQSPNLKGVSLTYDNLYGADLSGMNLSEANLSHAYLQGANLSGTNLSGANLQGAYYNMKMVQVKDVQGNPLSLKPTQWPQGFNPQAAGATCVDC